MFGDCHMHMVLDGMDFRKAMGQHRPVVREDWIRRTLAEYAENDIRYLRDGGDALGVARRASELAGEYGIEYRTPLFPICRKGRYGEFIGKSFEDFSGYRALVDEVVRDGGDFVKIMISGLMDFDHFGVITSTPLTREEIRDMIAYAHDRGMAVMAHANGAKTIMDALDAGVDSIEHGAYMNEECVLQLAESDAAWTPTLVTIGNLIGCGRFPDAVLEPLLELQLENVKLFADHGGILAAGSDAGAYQVPHVKGTYDEVNLFRRVLGDRTEAVVIRGEKWIHDRFLRQ